MKTSSQNFEKSLKKIVAYQGSKHSSCANKNLNTSHAYAITVLRQEIERFAKMKLGFDLVGFSPAKIDQKYQDGFRDWLKHSRHGDMSYMQKIQERFDLEKVLPGAKSVIVLGTNYYREQAPLKRGHGRVARYAYGRDYHKVIGKRLEKLEKFIKELVAKSQHATQPATLQSTVISRPRSAPFQLTKSYVDTGPILERALAEQAGIGRIGKNGCVISKEFGSWILLSEVITTLDLSSEAKSITGDTFLRAEKIPSTSGRPEASNRWSNPTEKSFNVCGNCTRCIDACPTGAIIAPGVVDSRLCISYLTIEHKRKLDPRLEKIIKKTKRVFGCDICQEVCPHNGARQRSSEPKASPASGVGEQNERSENLFPFHPPIAGDQLNLAKIRKIKSREDYIKAFAGSPLMRAKYIKSYAG